MLTLILWTYIMRLIVLLIGFMTLLAACTSSADRDARQRWYDSLTPDQQVRLEQSRMQAVGLFLGGGGFQSGQPVPYTYHAIPLPAPVYRPLAPCRSKSC